MHEDSPIFTCISHRKPMADVNQDEGAWCIKSVNNSHHDSLMFSSRCDVSKAVVGCMWKPILIGSRRRFILLGIHDHGIISASPISVDSRMENNKGKSFGELIRNPAGMKKPSVNSPRSIILAMYKQLKRIFRKRERPSRKSNTGTPQSHIIGLPNVDSYTSPDSYLSHNCIARTTTYLWP